MKPTRKQFCALETFQPDVAEYLRSVESERDAAIAAKEAAKRRATEIEQHSIYWNRECRKLEPVVEAARSLVESWDHDLDANEDLLRETLRALDAGEAPKPEKP